MNPKDANAKPGVNLRRLHLSCPVTCLKLDSSKKFLLVCQGPSVSVFPEHSVGRTSSSSSWSPNCLATYDVLPACRIHGLRVRRDEDDRNVDVVVFFGQKQLRIGRLHRETNCAEGEEEQHEVEKKKKNNIRLVFTTNVISAPDWLWEVKFLRSANERLDHLVLVTAHNQLRRFDVQTGSTICVAEAPERHILYSAAIVGDEWESLVVAAGTVFNCVVLWAPGKDEVVTLAGHDGVIFAIKYDTQLNILATASDDRSVRLWFLSSSSSSSSAFPRLSSSTLTSIQPILLSTLYGHSARVWDVQFFSNSSKLASIGEDANLIVWSIDASSLSLSSSHTSSLPPLSVIVEKKFQVQKGKNLLSLAIAEKDGGGEKEEEEETTDEISTLFVGGNDGSVRSYGVRKNPVPADTNDPTAPLPPSVPKDHSDSTSKSTLFSRSDYSDQAKAVAFLPSDDRILVLTQTGRLLFFDSVQPPSVDDVRSLSYATPNSSSATPPPPPRVLMDDPKFASYSVLEISSRIKKPFVFAVGNIHGVVRVFVMAEKRDGDGGGEEKDDNNFVNEDNHDLRHCRTVDLKIGDGKVQSIHFFPKIIVGAVNYNEDDDDNDDCFSVSLQDGSVFVYSISSSSSMPTILNVKPLLMDLMLPYMKQRWVTAAVLVEMKGKEQLCYDDDDDENDDDDSDAEEKNTDQTKNYKQPVSHHLFVCGDRTGNVHLFDSASVKTNLVKTFHKIHSKSGTTHLSVVDSTSSSSSFPEIRSLGRDGFSRSFRILPAPDSRGWTMEQTNASRVAKGFDWLERMYNTNGGGCGGVEDNGIDPLILGFHGDSFVVWDERQKRRLWAVSCGGGHRSWDFSITSLELSSPPDSSSSSSSTLRFASVVKGDVLLFERTLDATQLKSGESTIEALHGKQVTSVEVWRLDEKRAIVATGSEDTTVMIWAVDVSCAVNADEIVNGAVGTADGVGGSADGAGKPSTSHRVIATLTRHISSVRALALLNEDGDDEAILISGGGRAQICAWKIQMTPGLKSRSSETETVSVNLLADHRWNQISAKKKLRRKKKFKKDEDDEAPDLDLRYMALDARSSSASQRSIFVAAAGSDGFLRVFSLDRVKKEMTLVAQSSSENSAKCILGIRFLDSALEGGASSSSYSLCSSATDGNLTLWSFGCSTTFANGTFHIGQLKNVNILQDDKDSADAAVAFCLRPVRSFKCHQSGFSTFHFRHLSGSQPSLIRCLSGGDDNAVVVNTFEADEEENDGDNLSQGQSSRLKAKHRVTKADAHATQVTSVHWIDDKTFVSVSIDQRINVWRFCAKETSRTLVGMTGAEEEGFADSTENFHLIESRFTNVADVGSTALRKCPDGQHFLVIAGIGVETFKLGWI